ncbi:MAG TPA: DUF4350 domain-containing protein [Thermoanaerobaculia bacterium]|nr:DUF4350 domain-containing protein [Thermoanaerobaculia bacterium]
MTSRRAVLRRHRLAFGIALLLLVCSGLVLGLGGRTEARGSTLTRGPNGWLAARRYLEARGARAATLGAPLESFEGGGVLVTAFPWQEGISAEAAAALEDHLRRGGDLVLAYSGLWGNPGELVTLEGLGLPLQEVRKAPLDPVRWRGFARREWDLQPASGVRGAAPVRVWAPRWRPELPKEASVLFRTPRGGAAIAVLPRYRGRIVLLPADALANARLANPGNAGLLETLRRDLGDSWTFDEYHHGLIAGSGLETAPFGRTLDLILIHLALLYLAAIWTLSRRFGPAWDEATVVTGSTGAFLLGLGALHHRWGHHHEAAGRLLERVRELDPGLDLPAGFDARAALAGPRELVALAAEVAALRRGRPQEPTAVRLDLETAERETAA